MPGTYVDRRGNFDGDNFWTGDTGTIPSSNVPLKGQGTWTLTSPLPYPVHLAGQPRLRVRVNGPASGRLTAVVYDVSPGNTALVISPGITLIRDGKIAIELFPQDWRIAAGHRIGVLISGSDDNWWVPTPGTNLPVTVRSGWWSCRRWQYDATGSSKDRLVTGSR